MFVTLQDVYNVKSKFNVLANLGHREAIGVDILVQELMKEDHNPVLLYKREVLFLGFVVSLTT